MVDQTKIPSVEDIRAASLFLHREVLPRALLLHKRIAPTAGLSAVPPVGVPAGQVVGQEAPPGYRHAHGSVHKGFHLQLLRGICPDLLDFRQGKLPRQHHSGRAQLIKGSGGQMVDHSCLGGNMEGHLGRHPLCQGKNPYVADNKRVHSALGGKTQGIGQTGKLFISRQGVAGKINLDAAFMGVGYRFGKLLGEVLRRSAHAEFLSRQVHGVRPEVHAGFQARNVSGGAE